MEGADAAQGADEHLLGEVLCEMSVASANQEERVDGAVVLEVQGGERLPVARAGPGDQFGLRAGGRGGGEVVRLGHDGFSSAIHM